MITTAHAHKSGVIFHFFPRAFKQKKKIKALRPKMTKIASRGGGPALKETKNPELVPARLGAVKLHFRCCRNTLDLVVNKHACQILFSFSTDKDRRTDSRIRRKNTAQPRRESNPRSCEFLSHALTTELRSHNGNCV